MSHYSRRAAGSTPKDSFERVYFPYLHLVMRPLARVLLPCALRSRLSANQITLGAFLVYAGSAALFAVGGWSWRVAGAFLLNVSQILDCLDGEMARASGSASKRGEYLDAIAGYVSGAILLPAIGIGLMRSPEATLGLRAAFLYAPWAWVAVGLWTSLAIVLTRLINLRHQFLFGVSLRQERGMVTRLASWAENMLLPALLVGTLVNGLVYVSIGYAAFSTLKLLYAASAAVRGLGVE